jgi:hypothetical protein
MQQTHRWFFVIALFMGICLLAAHPVQATMPQTPSPHVVPIVGAPGTVFSFTAAPFHSERVGYWFNAPDGTIFANKYRYAVYTYDSQAMWQWQAPADAQLGYWSVVAQGEESGLVYVIPFEIRASAESSASAETASVVLPNTANVSVQPAVAYVGTNITFSVPRLSDERVGYWFDTPNGQVLGDDERYWFETNLNPAVWTWKVPSQSMPGIWKVTARGMKSGTQYSIFFEVRDNPVAMTQPTDSINLPLTGAVEPAIGYANTTFNFFAVGFPPRTQIQFWTEDPNGRRYDYDKPHSIGSNPDGRVDIAWRAPDNAMYGMWKMYFLSDGIGENNSRIERVVYFEVQPAGSGH